MPSWPMRSSSRLLLVVCVLAFGCTDPDNPDPAADAATTDSAGPDTGTDAEGEQPDAEAGDSASADAAPGDADTESDAAPDQPDGNVDMDGALEAGPPPDAALADAGDAALEAGGPTTSGGLCSACDLGEKLCGGRCVSKSKPENGCGGSCIQCPEPAHTRAGCGSGGQCVVAECEPGWSDCDGDVTNGCEADLSHPATCGGCGAANVCTGTTNICSASGCVATCAPPLTRCGDKCVSLTDSEANCGGCNIACRPNAEHAFAGECNGGTCGAARCFPGYTSCGSNCIDTTSNANACGSCTTSSCPAISDAVGTCEDSACEIVCQPGYTACPGRCASLSTDVTSCGSCGVACAAAESCVAGACVATSSLQLATGLSSPADLAVDGTRVYWTDSGNGTVKAIAKAGGTPITLAQGQAKPLRLALDDTHVYWGNNLGGAIMRAPKDGSGSAQLVTAATSPTYLVVLGDYLYFSAGSTIQRVVKSGGDPSAFITDPDPSHAFGVLLADSSAIYATDDIKGGVQSHAVVRALPEGGGAYTTLTTGLTTIPAIAIEGTTLYVKQGFTTRSVTAVNKVDGSSVGGQRVRDNQGWSPPYLNEMSVAPCGVFWTSAPGFIYLVRLGGSEESTLLTFASATRLVNDGQYLYWADTAGFIGKLAIPN